jgi:hypothetical protein
MTERMTIGRSTGMERMIAPIPRKILSELLKRADIYDVVEISRQEDVPKLYQALRFFPDNPDVTYIMPILEIRD